MIELINYENLAYDCIAHMNIIILAPFFIEPLYRNVGRLRVNAFIYLTLSRKRLEAEYSRRTSYRILLNCSRSESPMHRPGLFP